MVPPAWMSDTVRKPQAESAEVMSEIIAGVEVPDTAAVAEATRLVQETTTPLIYHHSRRVFFFGQIHAYRLGVKPDPELLYLAAMFHDTGLVTACAPRIVDRDRFRKAKQIYNQYNLIIQKFSQWLPPLRSDR